MSFVTLTLILISISISISISIFNIDARALKFSQNVDLMYTQHENEFGDLDLHSLRVTLTSLKLYISMNFDARALKFSHNVVRIGMHV
jgi:hypothetical protein